MNNDSGGRPHISVSKPPEPETTLEEVFILIATHPNGGEGIYGHKIGENMHTFVAQDRGIKNQLEKFLRDRGSIEVCKRDGVKLEWRRFTTPPGMSQREVIT